MVDLHRHDEFSTFDGYGKAQELAEIAKSLGHSSFSVSNHGNTNGLVQHYNACKKVGINCIMGVEAYFQPVFNKEQPRYHLCLFVKNLQGYRNLNKLMYAAERQRYYSPIVTFADLEKYSDGIICTTACIQGFVPKAFKEGREDIARKAAVKFKSIFGDDLYFEIQPYAIDDEGSDAQHRVNENMMWLADDLGIKCILTSDSHYGRKDEFDTYLKMHEIGEHTYDIEATYKERYMPTKAELGKRFVEMHEKSGDRHRAKVMLANLEEIEAKVEQNILDQLELDLPKLAGGVDGFEALKRHVQDGLREHGKLHDRKYVDRCKEELRVIKMHG